MEHDSERPTPPPMPPEPAQQVPYTTLAERLRGYVPPLPPVDPVLPPKSFWQRVDYLLRNIEDFRELLRQNREVPLLCGIFLTISVVMAGLYGGVMGATNLLQGSPMALTEKLAMIAVTGIKVPFLFLVTLGIVLPPIYVSNVFVGARLRFYQSLAMLLASVAIASTILASMATVALFFSLTTTSYHFIKLLHVIFFAYAGAAGLMFLTRFVREVARWDRRHTPEYLFLMWILLYMVVGTQLAWVLRPFVASPGEPFQLFRERHGSFYESVYDSAQRVMKKEKE